MGKDIDLLTACRTGDSEKVSALLSNRSKRPRTPLGFFRSGSATLKRQESQNSTGYESGTLPLSLGNVKEPTTGYTCAHFAAIGGHSSVLKCVLNHDCSLAWYRDKRGCIPLHLAVWYGRVECVRILLSHSDRQWYDAVRAPNTAGDTPLHLAAQNGHMEIARTLIEHAVDSGYGNDDCFDGDSATLSNRSADIGQCEGAAWPNARGETPLDVAARCGRTAVVRALLDRWPVHVLHAAQRAAQNSELGLGSLPSTPRHTATPSPSPRSVGKSASCGNASVNKHMGTGAVCCYPLHAAARNGHTDTCAALLAAGFDKDFVTASGSALHVAALYGRIEVVKLLLEAGADTNVRDVRGRTAADSLREHGNDSSLDVTQVIRSRDAWITCLRLIQEHDADLSDCRENTRPTNTYENPNPTNTAATGDLWHRLPVGVATKFSAAAAPPKSVAATEALQLQAPTSVSPGPPSTITMNSNVDHFGRWIRSADARGPSSNRVFDATSANGNVGCSYKVPQSLAASPAAIGYDNVPSNAIGYDNVPTPLATGDGGKHWQHECTCIGKLRGLHREQCWNSAKGSSPPEELVTRLVIDDSPQSGGTKRFSNASDALFSLTDSMPNHAAGSTAPLAESEAGLSLVDSGMMQSFGGGEVNGNRPRVNWRQSQHDDQRQDFLMAQCEDQRRVATPIRQAPEPPRIMAGGIVAREPSQSVNDAATGRVVALLPCPPDFADSNADNNNDANAVVDDSAEWDQIATIISSFDGGAAGLCDTTPSTGDTSKRLVSANGATYLRHKRNSALQLRLAMPRSANVDEASTGAPMAPAAEPAVGRVKMRTLESTRPDAHRPQSTASEHSSASLNRRAGVIAGAVVLPDLETWLRNEVGIEQAALAGVTALQLARHGYDRVPFLAATLDLEWCDNTFDEAVATALREAISSTPAQANRVPRADDFDFLSDWLLALRCEAHLGTLMCAGVDTVPRLAAVVLGQQHTDEQVQVDAFTQILPGAPIGHLRRMLISLRLADFAANGEVGEAAALSRSACPLPTDGGHQETGSPLTPPFIDWPRPMMPQRRPGSVPAGATRVQPDQSWPSAKTDAQQQQQQAAQCGQCAATECQCDRCRSAASSGYTEDIALDPEGRLADRAWPHDVTALVHAAVAYSCHYLGTAEVDSQTEDGGVAQALSAMSKLKCVEGPKYPQNTSTNPPQLRTRDVVKIAPVWLEISYRGVRISDGRDVPSDAKVAGVPTAEHPVNRIHRVLQDETDHNCFAYIMQDQNKTLAHVFAVLTADLATEIILTLGQAFEIAYKLSRRD